MVPSGCQILKIRGVISACSRNAKNAKFWSKLPFPEGYANFSGPAGGCSPALAAHVNSDILHYHSDFCCVIRHLGEEKARFQIDSCSSKLHGAKHSPLTKILG